jgi:hypothetical protein
MTKKEIKAFIALANTNVSYCQELKNEFHRQGKRVVRVIAKKLGLWPGTFDIRSNMAGIACSGEITLHAEKIYIQLGQSCFGPAMGFLYRRCNGRSDYCGCINRYMKWEELFDIDKAVEKFQKEMEN